MPAIELLQRLLQRLRYRPSARSRARRCAAGVLLLVLAACDNTTTAEHMAEAEALLDRKAYRAAIIELKNAIQKDLEFAPARQALGDAYLKTGDFASALIELERALNLGGDERAARLGIIRAKLGLNRVQEVIGELGDRELDTQESLLLGEAYLLAGRYQEARPLFEAGRDDAAGLAGLAAVAWSEGNLPQAQALYEQALEKDPDTASYWLRLAELRLRAEQYDEAIAAFAEAAKLPLGQVMGRIGEVRTLVARQDLDTAATRVEEVLTLAPDFPLAKYLKGLIAYQRDDIDAAEAALRDVQTSYPSHAPTAYLMGLVKFKQDQPAQAERNLQRYLAADPNSLSARKLLATLFVERGEPDRAVEILSPMAGRTKDAQLFAMLGSALMQTGRAAEATEFLQQAVQLDPEGASFRNQLALSLLSSGEDELAMAQLDAAVEVDGQQFQSDYLQALVSLRKGDLTRAETAIANLSAKAPDSPIGPNLMGAVAIARDEPKAAEVQFRKALAIDDGFAPARNNLVRLYEARGEGGAALALLKERTEAAPGDYAARLGYAEKLVASGQLDEARSQLERVVSLRPNLVAGRLALSRAQLLLGDADAASAVLEDGLAVADRNIDLLAAKADLQLQTGELEGAAATTRKLQAAAVNLAPNPALSYVIGGLQLRLGELDQAESSLQTAIARSGGSNTAAQLDLASVQLRKGRVGEAAQTLAAVRAQLSEDDPQAARLQLLEADVLTAEGKPQEAQKIYGELAALGNREGSLRLATAQLGSGDAQAGLDGLKAWVAGHPADQAARILLAGALLTAGEQDAAIAEYEALGGTGNAVVLNNLAWLYQQQGDERAVTTGRLAWEAAPDNADVADTYGWILVSQGRLAEGIKLLKESVRLRPGSPTSLYHLAVAYQRAEEPALARESVQEALKAERFPEREEAQALLRELDS